MERIIMKITSVREEISHIFSNTFVPVLLAYVPKSVLVKSHASALHIALHRSLKGTLDWENIDSNFQMHET